MKHPPTNIDQSCFDWLKIILQKTDLPSNAKYMALYLASHMNINRDFAWPGLKRIERETGLSHPSVLKYLDLLVSEGWIAKQSGSRVESNRYWISIPDRVGKELTYVTSGEKVGKEVTSNNNRITITSSSNKNATSDTKKTSSQKVKKDNQKYKPLAHQMWKSIEPITKQSKPPNIETWANDLRKLCEIDGRSMEEVERVFGWANRDNFWKTNILSAKKLREQFPQLHAKSKTNGSANTNWRNQMGVA